MVVLPPALLEGRGDIIIESQSRAYASKHRDFDALMA
jgi:hypothetical protein